MKGFTHLAAGTCAGIAISQAVCPGNGTETVLVIVSTAIGSILPDIDVGTSKLGRRIPVLSYTLQILFGHRGIFHSLLLWAIPIMVLCFTYPQHQLLFLCCGTGIVTHLLLDMLNPLGVPFLWPWSKRFTVAGFHSGGLIDWLMGGLFAVIAGLLLFTQYGG